MKINIYHALILGLASASSHAADVNQTITPLTNASNVMARCAAIAKNTYSIPAPAGQIDVFAAEHQNEVMTKEHAAAAANRSPAAKPKEMRAENLKSMTPEQKVFTEKMRSQRQELRKCGEDYLKTNAEAALLAKKVSAELGSSKAQPNDDDKKIGVALIAYMTAGETLSAEISTLSKSQVHQLYMGRTVRKYFLGHDVIAN